jgi:hypothetical protein
MDHKTSDWKVAADTLKKRQSWTADRQWSSSWGRREKRRLRINLKNIIPGKVRQE